MVRARELACTGVPTHLEDALPHMPHAVQSTFSEAATESIQRQTAIRFGATGALGGYLAVAAVIVVWETLIWQRFRSRASASVI